MVADRSGEVIAIASVFLTLATLFVGLRLYVRFVLALTCPRLNQH